MNCPLCCQQEFSSVIALKEHITYNIFRPLSCSICKITVQGIYDLIKHLDSQCNQCNEEKSVSNQIELIENMPTIQARLSNTQQSPCEITKSYYQLLKSRNSECELSLPMELDIQSQQCHLIEEENNVSRITEMIEEKKVKFEIFTDSLKFTEDKKVNYNDAVRAFVCTVCGSKIVGKDLYFTHLQQCKTKSLYLKEKDNGPITKKKFKDALAFTGNYELDQTSKTTLTSEEKKPYIHKKFDHDQGRKTNSVGCTDVQCYIQTFQSLLVDKLNQTLDNDREENIDISSVDKPISPDQDLCFKNVNMGNLDNLTKNATIEEKEIKISLSNRTKYQCNICSKMFSKQFILNKHIKNAHSNQPFSCQFCGKMFKSSQCLENHKGIHKQKSHHCSKCNHSCYTASGLRTHMFEIHTNKRIRKFQCCICLEIFKKKYGLERHRKRKHLEETSICKYCDKKFNCIEDLRHHMIIHSSESVLFCDICKGTFSTSKALKRHLLSHWEIKELYKCTECLKEFTRRDSLIKHERMHLQIQPFVCKCGKGFVTMHQLISHKTVHSKFKKFECQSCNKSFKFRVSLKSHKCIAGDCYK